MYCKSDKTRGAVSVFLVIILVPCIVIASIFVDLGRVSIAKSVSESSADLALNSLLTNYDADLNDWYGMVASCQSIEEFYEETAEYFLRMLTSQDLDDDEILTLSAYYANAVGDDSIMDLLLISSDDETSSIISAVDDADLTNAALIKEQVVEFMKYRAPIEITTSVIDRFSALADTDEWDEIMQSDTNEELANSKTDFYETEGELLSAAVYTYWALDDYTQALKSDSFTNDTLESYEEQLEGYKEAYEDIIATTISNFINTDGLEEYTRYTLSLSYTSTSISLSSIASSTETSGSETFYYVDSAKITSLCDDLDEKISEFTEAKTSFENAVSSLMSSSYGTGDSQMNEIQWWIKMDSALSTNSIQNNYNEAAKDMMDSYNTLLAIERCELDDDVSSDWKTELGYTELVENVQALQSKYLTSGKTDSSDDYLNAVNKLETVSKECEDDIDPSKLTLVIDGNNVTYKDSVGYIKSKLSSIISDVQGYIDLIDIVLEGDGENVVSLDELKSLASSFSSDYNTWSNTADSTDTSLGESDREEISELDEDYSEINAASVTELKTRLENIKSQLEDLTSSIDSMEFNGSKLSELNWSTFLSTVESAVSANSVESTNSDLQTQANTVISEKLSPNATVYTFSNSSNTNYNVTMNPATNQIDVPNLYSYLYESFQSVSKEDLEEAEDEKDDATDAGDTKEDEAISADRYHGGGTNIESSFSGNDSFSGSSILTGFMGLISDLFNSDLTNIRDDLYVTSYIMEMFSYATYDYEGRYNLYDDTDSLKLSNYIEVYETLLCTEENSDDLWISTDLKDSYNKSLTNQLINTTNNAAYEAEIEYILYGNETNTDNIKASYSDIYAVRYSLNFVSGFANFWTDDALNYLADMVFALSGGIIPTALVKVTVIPILTIFETSTDLDRLEAGFPVELYKSSTDDWVYSISGTSFSSFVENISSDSLELEFENKETGLFYSDYMMLFVYLGLNSSAQEDMYLRMSEVIQANMIKVTGYEEYSMENSKLYFELSASLEIEPLMITIPFFDDYENDLESVEGLWSFSVDTIRGY